MALVTLPLAGSQVDQIRIGGGLSILFSKEFTWSTLGIHSWFELRRRDHAVSLLSGTVEPVALAPLLELVGTRVDSATVEEREELRLDFANGTSLRVLVDPKFEAWEFAASDGQRVVCAAGGELTVWSPD